MDYSQKVEHNRRPIIGKDFTDLSESELSRFIQDARAKYFYFRQDGVNVACGKELDNNNGKFDREMSACRKLAEYGHEVYLLPENHAMDSGGRIRIHADTITDGRTLELKHTPSNVQGNYRKAKHQASDVFIHIKDDISKENALGQIKRAVRSMKQNNKSGIHFAGRVYLYFEKKNDLALFEFDGDGNSIEKNPKKIGPSDLRKPRRPKSA